MLLYQTEKQFDAFFLIDTFLHQISESHRQFGSPVVIHHVQQRERFPQHVNTDNIFKAHTRDSALRTNEEQHVCLNGSQTVNITRKSLKDTF